MLNFIKIVTTGDLKWLIKSGTPTGLNVIWDTIHSEYAEISENTSTSESLEMCVDIAYYKARIANTRDIVEYLRQRNVPELITELQEMGYNFTFLQLETDLDRVLTQSKGDEMRLAQAEARYIEKSTDSEQATEIEWRRRIAQISKYQGGGMINAALISVYDFVALEREFSDYIDMMKRQQKHDTASY